MNTVIIYTNFFIKSRIHNSSEGKIDNTDEDCAILDTDWSSVLESIR